MRLNVYLAGPGVFYPEAQSLAEKQKALCRHFGFAPLHPADMPADPASATAIYRSNLNMIHRADILLADLDPFRGPEADPGTAFEIGFAAALGKPVVAYSSSDATARERVARWYGPIAPCPQAPGVWRDRDGNLVEDFGHPTNLMLAESCAAIVAGDLETALLWLRDHATLLLGTTQNDATKSKCTPPASTTSS